ncbi:hypothetical protein [Psychromonas sp. KJ10-2]|uniref:hypothetical protein n=1 Tax=Psychromonas sp. KJ10-2 TaxID=3391822 RepID=UPI0039B4AF03
MENSFENFVAQFKAQQPVSLAVFFYQAELHLIKQLKDYLQIEQTTERSFFHLSNKQRKSNKMKRVNVFGMRFLLLIKSTSNLLKTMHSHGCVL